MATEAWKKNNVEKLRKYRRDHYHRNRDYYINQVTTYKQNHVVPKPPKEPLVKADRNDPTQRPKWIVYDSRSSDRKFKRENDLDASFVTECIKNGCSYCDSQEGMLVLDRKDNSIGHVKDNVNASCYRCNFLRGDMPYEAWLMLVPAIKEVRKAGLFGNWKLTRKYKKKKKPA